MINIYGGSVWCRVFWQKNAKMDKMGSLTSRRLERENMCFTTVHDWRVWERWKVRRSMEKYHPGWLIVDWGWHQVGLVSWVPSSFSGRPLRILVTMFQVWFFLMDFALYLEMISLLETGFCSDLNDCAQSGTPIFILEWIPFLLTGSWILLGHCC